MGSDQGMERSPGFTLVELIATVFITMILMMIAVHSYRLYHARSACLGAALILAQDLKLAGSRCVSLQRTAGITVDSATHFSLWETSPYTGGTTTDLTVDLGGIFPISVSITAMPGGVPGTITFFPQSTHSTPSWAVMTVHPSGTFTLQSGNVTHQVQINSAGNVTIQ